MLRSFDRLPEYSSQLFILLVIGFLGYLLPWAVAPSAPMTLNAYDLAEWTSLHPAQRLTSPPLLAPLLLRLQLVILTVLVAALASRQSLKALSGMFIVALAVSQLPPFEYVYDIANMNYKQQFILAVTSFVAGLVVIRFGGKRVLGVLASVLPVVGIISATYGISLAYDLFEPLQPGGSIGLGLWILLASYAGIVVMVIYAVISRVRRISRPDVFGALAQ